MATVCKKRGLMVAVLAVPVSMGLLVVVTKELVVMLGRSLVPVARALRVVVALIMIFNNNSNI